MPEVKITYAGERPGRPPLVRMLVDATVTNPAAELRWVLIPTQLPGGSGGIDKLEQLAAGPVKLGRFLGTGGFYALALAPGARLTVKNLELGWWNADNAKSPPQVEVRLAEGLTLGGEAIASWFDGDPAVRGAVEVDAGKAQHTRSKRAAGDREVAVKVVGGDAAKIAIDGRGATPDGTARTAQSATLEPAEWKSGFPVPKGARRNASLGGATTLAPGKNYSWEVHDVDAGIQAVTAFFTRHLPDAGRSSQGQTVKFSKAGGSVELAPSGEGTRITLRWGPL